MFLSAEKLIQKIPASQCPSILTISEQDRAPHILTPGLLSPVESWVFCRNTGHFIAALLNALQNLIYYACLKLYAPTWWDAHRPSLLGFGSALIHPLNKLPGCCHFLSLLFLAWWCILEKRGTCMNVIRASLSLRLLHDGAPAACLHFPALLHFLDFKREKREQLSRK